MQVGRRAREPIVEAELGEHHVGVGVVEEGNAEPGIVGGFAREALARKPPAFVGQGENTHVGNLMAVSVNCGG